MLKRVIVGSGMALAGWAAYSTARRWWATWGIDPAEAEKVLPGDALVADPTAVDTRGITIEAPPNAVWPWLVQMGYGRAGWYSYDRLDMEGRSADTIVPELQQLAIGDVLPTDPGGGFVVKVMEPERALVVLVDTEIVAARRVAATESLPVAEAPGLAASGRFLEKATPPQFSASWAFVLEPLDGGRTRFIERFRIRYESATAGSRLLAPILGFGVFVMMQRQMKGIRDRAERLAGRREPESWVVTPARNGTGTVETPVAIHAG